MVAVMRLFAGLALASAYTTERKRREGVDVYFVTEMLDKFSAGADQHQLLSEQLHAAKEERIRAAMELAPSEEDQSLLEKTLTMEEEHRLQERNVYAEMQNFANTMRTALGGYSRAKNCHQISCGENANCIMDPIGAVAKCVCDENYTGDGHVCKAPKAFASFQLLGRGTKSLVPTVAETHITVFDADRIVATWRSLSDSNRGYAMLGMVQAMMPHWDDPVVFSQGPTYDPVAAGVVNKVVVGYRDNAQGGNGFVIMAKLNEEGKLTFGKPAQMAINQSQRMVIMPVGIWAAVMWAGWGQGDPKPPVGLAALLNMNHDYDVKVRTKFQFCDEGVSELDGALMMGKGFVLAYRSQSNKAAAVYAKKDGMNLVFYKTGMINVAPNADPWQRSVALVAKNEFSYTFFDADKQQTVQSIVKIAEDPSQPMQKVAGPTIVSEGETPFVGGVSLPFAPGPAATFNFYQSGSFVAAQTCRIASETNKPGKCKATNVIGKRVKSINGVSFQNGKMLFVYSDNNNVGYFSMLSMEPAT